MSVVSIGAGCPKCGTETISRRSAEPWCPACEWNLDCFDPGQRSPEMGWRWLDRRLFRAAYRLTESQYAELREAPALARAATSARIATIALAVPLLAVVAALLVIGVGLLVHDFFEPLNLIGALLILIAVVLRPRLGRLSGLIRDGWQLDRDTAPTLFAVIERVAAAAGTPMPHVVVFTPEFNASTTTVGLRRRRVLRLGAPLWAVLDPQERVALLGHELGHFVNGDVRRGLLTQAVESTLGQVAYLLRPDLQRTRLRPDARRGMVRPARGSAGTSNLIGMIAESVVDVVAGILAELIGLLHLLLVSISRRDSQRAEYLADELAAKVAGSAAVIRMIDVFLLADGIDTVTRREARAGNGAAAWRAAADQARVNQATGLAAYRQLSRRAGVSVFATHPPDGLRAGLLAARPAQPAAVVMTEPEQARMDDELAASYESVRRELVATW
ncbi:Zn-dependent protease [Actinoplanes sp. SE50]|uniref:M48 family metalloprotease n=1 Tax=unclassified Actinoplanes TaxID=2626549 RepID=UPI00023EC1F0|nr:MULTISPECIES: M48 family metallopeptidase [unclassified Actinoplanes]AEV81864.1 Zn-dependent protease [Actinoplanes sp. SE50/110]ATO80265.1 Zn-dependent protease [Actinoplanes sp. SE50]SLL97670.1 Zn-dependent protease [Actinoplanes sp. SE50/110]